MGINQNLLHFSLSSSDPRKVDKVTLENFYGFLEGGSANSEADTGATTSGNPVIAIIAYYDTFGISPVYIYLLSLGHALRPKYQRKWDHRIIGAYPHLVEVFRKLWKRY